MIIFNFAIAFIAIILIHELGHFLAAKLMGVKVDIFSIGFGPRLINKAFGDTNYQIALVPLGGYVKMSQESHDSKPAIERIIISLAGPLANLVAALIIFIGLYISGVPSLSSRVGDLQTGKPAIAAGVQKGDLILSVNGVAVKYWDSLVNNIAKNPVGSEMQLYLQRGKQLVSITVNPEFKNGKAFIGIAPSSEQIIQKHSLFDSVKYASSRWWKEISNFYKFVVGFATGSSSTSDIGGPVAIAGVANKAAQSGIFSFILVIAILSVNLGTFNLLPLPVLDGGTSLLLLYELITKRAVPIMVRVRINQTGIIGLSALVAWSFLNDLK